MAPRERAEAGGIQWDALRNRLVRARTTAPLFRTADFTREFEGVLQDLLRKAVVGETARTTTTTATATTAPPSTKKKKKKKKKKKTNK